MVEITEISVFVAQIIGKAIPKTSTRRNKDKYRRLKNLSKQNAMKKII